MKTERKRDYALDFLKVVATAVIVFHHYQQGSGTVFASGINFYGGGFDFGFVVELFFLLSGYFMLGYGDRIKSGLSFKTFYVSRMVRLLPVVAVSTAVAEILLVAYQSLYAEMFLTFTPSLWAWIVDSLGIRSGWVFSMLSANNPTWYVSVLLLCCAEFYLLTVLSSKLKISASYFYLGMILVGLGVRSYGINLPFLNAEAARGYYAFFAGVLLARWLHGRKISRAMADGALLVIALFVLTWVYALFAVAETYPYLLTFFVYPSVVIVCETSLVQKVFSARIWGLLSAISYDVYIWHFPMIMGIYVVTKAAGTSFEFSDRKYMLLFLLAAELVGAFSYFCIEKPLRRRCEQLALEQGLLPGQTDKTGTDT